MNQFTELENKVIENLRRCDTYDELPYSCVEDIASGIGESTKIVRGVISSLSQKDVINVETGFFSKKDTIIFLMLKD